MANDLEWYVADMVDEACPPSKASPEDYAFFDGERWILGYAPDDKRVLDEDREACNRAIAAGDVVEFMTCERMGEIEATLRRDGSYTPHGEPPRGYDVVIVNGDSDLLYHSLEDLMRAITAPNEWCNPAELIFEGDADTERVTLDFAAWSDPLPHLFEVVDGKPAFRPVPAEKH